MGHTILIYLYRRRLVLLRYFEISNYKKPSLHQSISRLSFTIPTYRFLSYSSSPLPSFFWYYPDNEYLLLQNISFQAKSKIHSSSKVEDTSILWFSSKHFVSSSSADIKKYIYVVILPLSITFDLLSHLQNLFYTNTIFVSQSQCRSACLLFCLIWRLVLTTTLRAIRPTQQSTVNITTHIILAFWLTSDTITVQGITVFNQHSNVHEAHLCGMF